MGRDLKTAPHSQTVSIFSGGLASLLNNHAARMPIGIQLTRERSAVIRLVMNRLTKLIFLVGEDQKYGSVIRAEAVANSARKTPTQRAVLSAFQFGLEKGAIAMPTMSHVVKYRMKVFQASGSASVV